MILNGEEIRCPDCGKDDAVRVQGRVWCSAEEGELRVGSDSELDYDGSSSAHCWRCNKYMTLGYFLVPEPASGNE